MKQIKPVIKNCTLALSTAILLSACGGGSSSSNSHSTASNTKPNNQPHTSPTTKPETKLIQGQFIDSAVANLAVYQDDKKISTTNSEGFFNYQTNGGIVTFKVGNLTLGSTAPKAIVTPADLASDSENVVKILQVLQSLDEDSKPDNGIFIPQTRIDKLITAGDLSKSNTKIVKTVQHDIPDLDIVGEKQAIVHFAKAEEMLASSEELSQVANNMQGYWLYPCDKGNKSFIIEITKESANKLKVKRLSERVYKQDNCQGNFETISSNKVNAVTLLGVSENSANQTVVNSLYENQSSSGTTYKLSSDIVTNNNFRNYMRIEQPIFPNEAVTPKPINKVEEAIDRFVKDGGYWKSSCLSSGENGSRYHYLKVAKHDSISVTIEKSINEVYKKNNYCSGNSSIVYDNPNGATHSFNTANYPNFRGDNTVIINSGEGEPEKFTRLSASQFPK